MPIVPDTKDWTWVLREQCPDCGFNAGEFPPTAVADRVRADLPRWTRVLARENARDRPDDHTWSPTEYACHVRDVYTLFAERARQILDVDDPQFANWDQDETALTDDYASQDPDVVSGQLVEGGLAIAAVWASVPDDAWDRQGRRSDGAVFTTATLSQYFLHDVTHHLHDVRG
jgi:Rad3-related DNA helicase